MKEIALRHVVTIVAETWQVDPRMIAGPSREWRALIPRVAAALLMREMRPDVSLIMIGRSLGDRDHSTVLNAIWRARPGDNGARIPQSRALATGRSGFPRANHGGARASHGGQHAVSCANS